MSAGCIACGCQETLAVAAIPSVPVFANVLSDDAATARALPRAGIDLTLCPACGHLFNASFDPELLRYDGSYENSLHGSPRFQAYLEGQAADLVRRNALAGRDVVEVGCGDGRFLELLVAAGARTGIGYDPGARAAERPDGVAVHARAYVPGADARGDLVASRHVLEHMADPASFLDLLAAARRDSASVVFVEVPNGAATLAGAMIWDLIYEHCSYFSPRSLSRLMAARGFADVRVRPVFDGQFLAAEGQEADGAGAHDDGADSPVDEVAQARAFAEQFWAAVAGWQGEIQRHAADGRRVMVWGAGSKGVTFANLVDPEGAGIAAFVDVNPLKAGRFVAGTGHPVLGPEALPENAPDVVILMNPIYRGEVEGRLAELGLAPQLRGVDDVPAGASENTSAVSQTTDCPGAA